ncbi:MAG: serine/threonine protein kinase, partial [Planctomycetota bacterium]
MIRHAAESDHGDSLKRICILAFLLLVFHPLIHQSSQADEPVQWTGWLGPNRDGFAGYFVPPKTWPESLSRQWSLTVGEGYGTPLVV